MLSKTCYGVCMESPLVSLVGGTARTRQKVVRSVRFRDETLRQELTKLRASESSSGRWPPVPRWRGVPLLALDTLARRDDHHETFRRTPSRQVCPVASRCSTAHALRIVTRLPVRVA